MLRPTGTTKTRRANVMGPKGPAPNLQDGAWLELQKRKRGRVEFAKDTDRDMLATRLGKYPLPHASTHYPISGDDPLPYGTAVSVGLTNSAGNSNYYSLSNHVHASAIPNYTGEPTNTFEGHSIFDTQTSLVKRRRGSVWDRLGPLQFTDGVLTTAQGVVKVILPVGSFTKNDTLGEVTLNLFTGLTVKDSTPPPTITDVTTLVFPNGYVADNGGGQVTITFPASLTIKDTAPPPTVTAVNTIVFPDGTVTDDGGGQVTVVFVPASSYGSTIKGTKNITAVGSTLLIPRVDHVHAALVGYGSPPGSWSWYAIQTPTNEVGAGSATGNLGSLGMGILTNSGKFSVYMKKAFLPLTGGDWADIQMLTPLVGYVLQSSGSAGNRVSKTTNGGGTWTDVANSALGQLVVIYMFSELVGVMAKADGTIYRTTDGFATTPTQVLAATSKQPYQFFFLNDNVGWIVGATGLAYQTADNGATWTNVAGTGAPTTNIYSVWLLDAVTAIAGNATKLYLVTYAAGSWTWTDKTPTASARYYRIKMWSATVGYAVGATSTNYICVWKTSDAGVTWAAQNSGSVGYELRDLIVLSATSLIVSGRTAASTGIIYTSSNSGVTLTQLTFDSSDGLSSSPIIKMVTANNYLNQISQIWAMTAYSGTTLIYVSVTGGIEAVWKSIGPTDIIAPSDKMVQTIGQLWMDGALLKYWNGTTWTSVRDAGDADTLDTYHASSFSLTTHNHDAAYLGIVATATDSDKVDGSHASAFAAASHAHAATDITSLTLDLARIPATLTGKDADTLDTYHAAAFGRLAAANEWTLAQNIKLTSATAFIVENASGTDTLLVNTTDGKVVVSNRLIIAPTATTPTFADTSALSISESISNASCVFAISIQGTYESTGQEAYGIWLHPSLIPKEGGTTTGGTFDLNVNVTNRTSIVSSFGLTVKTMTKTGAGAIGTACTLYLQHQTVGATNYTFYSDGGLHYFGGDFEFPTVTGTKIGTATSQLIGFYNQTPVDQPAAVANATDAASVILRLNDLLARMRELGLIAT